MHRCAQRRTGGEGRAQQPGGRVSGADGVGIEPRVAVGGDAPQVAAPWIVRVSPHEFRRSHGLAHSHGRDAARRLGLDPRGARRALVAALGAGHVRTCARAALSLPQQPRTPVPERSGSTQKYPPSIQTLPTTRQRRGLPSSTPEYPSTYQNLQEYLAVPSGTRRAIGTP